MEFKTNVEGGRLGDGRKHTLTSQKRRIQYQCRTTLEKSCPYRFPLARQEHCGTCPQARCQLTDDSAGPASTQTYHVVGGILSACKDSRLVLTYLIKYCVCARIVEVTQRPTRYLHFQHLLLETSNSCARYSAERRGRRSTSQLTKSEPLVLLLGRYFPPLRGETLA